MVVMRHSFFLTCDHDHQRAEYIQEGPQGQEPFCTGRPRSPEARPVESCEVITVGFPPPAPSAPRKHLGPVRGAKLLLADQNQMHSCKHSHLADGHEPRSFHHTTYEGMIL